MAHITIATDFSETSWKAAQFALDQFGAIGNRYTILHTYLKPALNNALLPNYGAVAEQDAKRGIRRFERRCRVYAGQVRLAKVISPFSLPDALNELDERKGVDMVVMGTQGQGNYGLVGTNTKATIMGSVAPVIAVPHRWTPTPVKRILLAYDNGVVEREDLQPLLSIIAHCGAELVVAHVRKPARQKAVPVDRKVFGDLLQGVPHSFVTSAGDDTEEAINTLVNTGKIDLVVVLHRQLGFLEGLFHRSAAKNLALQTKVPLLVLKG